MNKQAFLRLILLLGIGVAGGFTYETWSISGYRERTGTVVRVNEDAYPVARNNDTVYTIEYQEKERTRSVKTSAGVVARYVTYPNLQEGDRIPLLVDPERPSSAVIHSFADTHPFTVCAGALLLLVIGVGSWSMLTSADS